MKKVLSIAIVICLAVTMTCSSFAVDDYSIIDSSAEVTVAPEADSINGAEVPCPYCSDGIIVSLTRVREVVDAYYITCSDHDHGYDLVELVSYYDVLVCDRCGTTSTYVKTVIETTCYGYDN